MTQTFKRLFLFFLIIFGSTFYFFWPKQLTSPPQNETMPVIAITQIIEHHTLDTVRKGLMVELAANGFDEKSAKIIYENAHGNVATATQIGTKFASLQPKILVALSTQSAQILLPLTSTMSVPLVFTAVTNPVAAKLISKKPESLPLVTGVSDFMEPEPQLEMMRAFLPHLVTLGVLYNPAEVNSVSFLNEMETVAKTKGIRLVYAALNTTADATSATISLIGKVDAIYFPNDNTAMAAVGAIVLAALKHKVPVFANDSASVEKGALAALAYDRYAMGRKTGEIVSAILKGTKPNNIPVVYDTPSEVVVNEKTLISLNVPLPKMAKEIRKL